MEWKILIDLNSRNRNFFKIHLAQDLRSSSLKIEFDGCNTDDLIRSETMKENQRMKTLTLLIAILVICTLSASGATFCVNPTGTGGCYRTIQLAINAAATKDTVSVMPGTYAENLTLNKNIVLYAQQGTPCATNIMPPTGTGVTFAAGSSGATMVGFTVEASAGTGVFSNAYVDTIGIYNCTVQNCMSKGVYFSAGGVRVQNCVIQSNLNWGIDIEGMNALVSGSIVVNNHSGLCALPGLYAYNCVYGNSLDYFNGPGVGDINLDPKLVDPANCDFHLQSISPCIDKGRPGISNFDCDGTFNDMGVYGGPNAYCGPGPVVTDLQLIPATIVKGETFKIQAKGATR